MTKSSTFVIQEPEKAYATCFPGTPHEYGIPLLWVVFQDSIQSFGAQGGAGEPENALYEVHPKKSRQAKLWKSGDSIVVEQKYGKYLIPWAKVKTSCAK